jgi:hypothetical protein
MESIKQKLQELESILQKYDAPVLKHLNPGIPKEEIEIFLTQHGIKSNEALISLYEWHNGLDILYGNDLVLSIFPDGKFFNLNEMVRIKHLFSSWEYLEIEHTDEYIPIFGTGEADMYLLNQSTMEVFYLNPNANIYCEPYFKSVNLMIQFIIECYNEEIFIIDPIKGLIVDFDKYYIKSTKRRK